MRDIGEKKHYGLIGHPVAHSFSAEYFTQKFHNQQINAEYHLIDLPLLELLPDLLKTCHWNGLNVTIPHKSAIIPYLHHIDPTAHEIGAVNTITIDYNQSGEPILTGHNTDVIGFHTTLKEVLNKINKENHQALILGTGGASLAVQYVLKSLNINYKIVSRTSNAQDIWRITYNDITPEIIASHNIIINTTPLGMHPNVGTAPEIPYHLLTPDHILYDLVYNPDPTLFLLRGAQQGCTTISGLKMLHAQAEAAYCLWEI